MVFLPLTGLVFGGFYLLPIRLAIAAGVVLLLLSSVYAVRSLVRLLPASSIPSMVRPWLPRFGLASAGDGMPGE
jgi:PST family polysaccharide transporter